MASNPQEKSLGWTVHLITMPDEAAVHYHRRADVRFAAQLALGVRWAGTPFIRWSKLLFDHRGGVRLDGYFRLVVLIINEADSDIVVTRGQRQSLSRTIEAVRMADELAIDPNRRF